MLVAELERGWAAVPGTLKYHYFQEGQTHSLCGRWKAAKVGGGPFINSNHGCADHCAGCNKKRQQQDGQAD